MVIIAVGGDGKEEVVRRIVRARKSVVMGREWCWVAIIVIREWIFMGFRRGS